MPLRRINIYTSAPVNSRVADIAHRLNSTSCLVVVLPLEQLGPERKQLLAAQTTLAYKLDKLNQELKVADGLLDESRRLRQLQDLLAQREQCQAHLDAVAAKLGGETRE